MSNCVICKQQPRFSDSITCSRTCQNQVPKCLICKNKQCLYDVRHNTFSQTCSNTCQQKIYFSKTIVSNFAHVKFPSYYKNSDGIYSHACCCLRNI